MDLKLLKRKYLSLKQTVAGNARVSFSQFGEDLLIKSALDLFRIENNSYLDIGANEPVRGNNTYLLYQRGYRGVLIEPNPRLFQKLITERPGDTALNVGIGFNTQEKATYYLFPEEHNALNTFSEEEKNLIEAGGIKVEKVIEVPLQNINEIISTHFGQGPAVISIDVEGLDEAIIASLDFSRHAPDVVCVESISFSSYLEGRPEKRQSLIDLILSKGYFIFADTFYNTIFVANRNLRREIQKPV